MLEDKSSEENDELLINHNACVPSENIDESSINIVQLERLLDAGWRKEIDNNNNDHGKVKDNEISELVDQISHLQMDGEELQYSHPDIVFRKETTFFSYHDSDSDLIDYVLDTGSLYPASNLDKSDADSWDWTFHDENLSDLDIKVAPIPRKKSSLLTNISENNDFDTQEERHGTGMHKKAVDNEYGIHNTHNVRYKSEESNDVASCGKTPSKKYKWEKSIPARQYKNMAVTFSSRQNVCNGCFDKEVQTSNKFKSSKNVVYFEDLQSSQVFKTRLKYLGSNCSVGSTTSSSKGVTRTNGTNTTKRHGEFTPANSKQEKLSNMKKVYKKFTKLEEMFTLSCRHVRNNETMKVKVIIDKNVISSPLSLSLSKSDAFLPTIVDSKVSSTSGQRRPMIGVLPEKLIGWKVNKSRAMSRWNMLAKSVPKEDIEKTPDYLQSLRHHQNLTGLARFRHSVRMVLILLRAIGLKPKRQEESNYNFLSWSVVYDEVLGVSRLNYDNGALTFDPLMYKANKESTLSQETKDILRLPSSQRTEAQIHTVMINLHNVIQSFSEFPKRIQQSMVKVCMYEKFEAGRVIIRQGHRAENFYFIISGSAVVTKMESGQNHVHTTSVLGKGNSFGELAFLHMSKRSATVTCREDVELISIERNDFINIFMCPRKGQEPDHITFLKSLDLLQGWPVQLLPHDNPKICAFTYVRRDVILCQNSTDSDWIFVVYSGTCKVLAALDERPIRRREERSRLPEIRKITVTSDFFNFSKLCATSPIDDSSLSEMEGQENLQHQENLKEQENIQQQENLQHQENLQRKENIENQETLQHQENLQRIENLQHKENQQCLDSLQRQKSLDHMENTIDEPQKENPAVFVRNLSPNSKNTHSDDPDGSTQVDHQINNNNNNDDDFTCKQHILSSIDHSGQVQDRNDNNTPKRVSFQVSQAPATPSMFKQKRQLERLQSSALQQQVPPQSGTQTQQQQQPVRKTTFIEIARLEAGDMFGLEHVVLSGMRDVASCSLVSEGAEVVLISRSFFRKHLTEETMKRMRQTIRPLPSEKSLQKKYETKKLWDVYKSQTMARHGLGVKRLTAKLQAL